jgi:hypothetical protein
MVAFYTFDTIVQALSTYRPVTLRRSAQGFQGVEQTGQAFLPRAAAFERGFIRLAAASPSHIGPSQK